MRIISFHKKVFRFGSIACVFSTLHASQPPIDAYIRIEPEGITVLCRELQQNLYNFLAVSQRGQPNRLSTCGLDKKSGYTYKSLDLTNPCYRPHVSLLEVPQGRVGVVDMEVLRDILGELQVPTAFSFGRLKAFLPFTGSNKIWIVAVTRSNISNGFNNLVQGLSGLLNIQPRIDPTEDRFTAHITLAYIEKQPGAFAFTQDQIARLNGLLQNFTRQNPLTTGSYPTTKIMYSPHVSKGQAPMQLWP